MTNSAKGLLITLLFALLTPLHAFQGPPPIGLFDGLDFPDSPYVGEFLSSRVVTFNVKNGSGKSTASGSYSLRITYDELLPVKGSAETKDLSSLTWDFQLPYYMKTSPRAGDYTFKMNAPLGGVFSNVLFATTNVPPVIVGQQAGSFFMTEKRMDMSHDLYSDIIWQRDDGHLGVWFMGGAGTSATIDTNLTRGIYFDSLYLATGHQNPDPNWRIVCQSDLDLNGMQDWIWQNTNSGKLRVWLLANTNFVDASIEDLNYHHYSQPEISTFTDPNDYTVTTNLTPTFITNIFNVTTTTVKTQTLSGPHIEVTTVYGTNVSTANTIVNVYETNTFYTTIENVTAVTNVSGGIDYLTNKVVVPTVVITTNSFLDYALTNVTSVQLSGRVVNVTNVLNIPNLVEWPGETMVLPNFANRGVDLTNIFVYTNYDNIVLYTTNVTVTTYADIIGGYYLVTYTTNYHITSTTTFVNPFVREVMLDEQSPDDAGTRLICCADLDNDGFPDYVFRKADGSIFFADYFESFQAAISNPNRFLSGDGNLGWCVSGLIDLNTDGWPDVLWQNMKSGATAIWYMRGVSDPDSGFTYNRIRTGGLTGATPAPNLKIVANADFNRDGQMDVLLRNTKTGQLVFWYLNGSNVIKKSTIGGPVVPWQVAGPK